MSDHSAVTPASFLINAGALVVRSTHEYLFPTSACRSVQEDKAKGECAQMPPPTSVEELAYASLLPLIPSALKTYAPVLNLTTSVPSGAVTFDDGDATDLPTLDTQLTSTGDRR